MSPTAPLSHPLPLSTCLFSCQSPLSLCLCQSTLSLFSHPGPLIVLFSPPFSLSAILHFYLYPPLLSCPLCIPLCSKNEKTWCFPSSNTLIIQRFTQHFSKQHGFNLFWVSVAPCSSSLLLYFCGPLCKKNLGPLRTSCKVRLHLHNYQCFQKLVSVKLMLLGSVQEVKKKKKNEESCLYL